MALKNCNCPRCFINGEINFGDCVCDLDKTIQEKENNNGKHKGETITSKGNQG